MTVASTPPTPTITAPDEGFPSPRRASSLRQFATMLLLAVGAQVWIGLGRADVGERRQLVAGLLAVVGAVVVWMVPSWRARAERWSQRVSAESYRGKLTTAVVI